MKNIKKIEEPLINKEIIKLFLEKLEQLSNVERQIIIKAIQLISSPIFFVDSDIKLKNTKPVQKKCQKINFIK